MMHTGKVSYTLAETKVPHLLKRSAQTKTTSIFKINTHKPLKKLRSGMIKPPTVTTIPVGPKGSQGKHRLI